MRGNGKGEVETHIQKRRESKILRETQKGVERHRGTGIEYKKNRGDRKNIESRDSKGDMTKNSGVNFFPFM